MSIGLAGTIVEAIMEGPEGSDAVSMSIAGIDPKYPKTLLLPERSFQYWPDTISDSIDIGWSFKDIPGTSHSLAQWGSNSGRTITFEVQLHRFMKPRTSLSVMEKVRTMATVLLTTPASTLPKDERPHNVDIAEEIRFLRAFCYPYFDELDDIKITRPPPVAILAIPGLPLKESSGESVMYAVMTSCDITYTLLFPNGTPRRATLSLTFRQIVQRQNEGVSYAGHPLNYDSGAGDEGLAPGGARPLNDIPESGDI